MLDNSREAMLLARFCRMQMPRTWAKNHSNRYFYSGGVKPRKYSCVVEAGQRVEIDVVRVVRT